VVTTQQTWLPLQSAFWSHEICTIGPTKSLGVGQLLPVPQT
jgi:hypothetical protein